MEYGNNDYTRSTKSKFLFTSLAQADDAVVSITHENKTRGKDVFRVDSLKSFKEGKLSDAGAIPYNTDLMQYVVCFDIVPADKVDSFVHVLDKPANFLGYPSQAVSHPMVNILHQLGVTEI